MEGSSSSRVYKEGYLLKRARGLRSTRNIKWQERFCKLTGESLDYYDPKKTVRETSWSMHHGGLSASWRIVSMADSLHHGGQ